MAGLLFRRVLISLFAAFLFVNAANAFESSFPFPFEFGHSSDIYLDIKKPVTKETRQKNQEAADILRQRGIKSSPEDFVSYIKNNDIGTVKLILDAGFDPNTCINADYPIFYAAKYNRKQIIKILLEQGADPNKGFSSPLRYTILRKDYDTTKLLLDYGANAEYTDMLHDETLLYSALKKKQYDIAALLLDKGAQIEKKSYRLIKKNHLEKKLGTFID